MSQVNLLLDLKVKLRLSLDWRLKTTFRPKIALQLKLKVCPHNLSSQHSPKYHLSEVFHHLKVLFHLRNASGAICYRLPH